MPIFTQLSVKVGFSLGICYNNSKRREEKRRYLKRELVSMMVYYLSHA
ncbi:hypothetical protein [Alkaliphilus metalliredigens]|nr:hypothetical protein [Alkaliphilus metalliredigens]